MFKFPKGLYTDVRMEDVFETKIIYTMGEIEESKIRSYKAAFIRIFDGERWYYSSTSNMENIQNEINSLATYAKPNEGIYDNPIVAKFQSNNENLMKFEDNSVAKIEINEKQDLLKEYFPLLKENKLIKHWKTIYVDRKIDKEFYSSKGANVLYDTQIVGLSVRMNFVHGEKRFSESFQKGYDSFRKLSNNIEECKSYIKKCEDFLLNSQSVEPGKYTVILSPLAAGVFAHESFGHKSEADFMIGDETMRKEWAIGKKVGSNILSIIDDGNVAGSGYVQIGRAHV